MKNSSGDEKWPDRYMNPTLSGLASKQQRNTEHRDTDQNHDFADSKPRKDTGEDMDIYHSGLMGRWMHAKMSIFYQVSLEFSFLHRDWIEAWLCDFSLG